MTDVATAPVGSAREAVILMPLSTAPEADSVVTTFIDLVFAHAHVTLLDEATWETGRSPERRAEDEAAQRRLVKYLRQTVGAAKHAELVEKEIPCTRIRAEEVAAASGMTGHPIPFARVEPEGARILAVVQAQVQPAPEA